MPLTWIEDGESRSATIARRGRKAQSSYRKSFKVFGTTDDTELHADINTRITASYAYWQYPGVADMQLRAESYSVSYLGDDAWQVTIDYIKDGAESEDTAPLKRSRQFDTTGGTQHITQDIGSSLVVSGNFIVAQSAEMRYPSEAPAMNGAIGVDENGVNGVDIVVPQLQWTETYDVPSDYVTNNYIKNVSSLTGTVNSAPFREFFAGEVLFLGCSGTHEWDDQRGYGPWSLTYKFIASPNTEGQTIGDITGIMKGGHDYLWVLYESATSQHTLIKKPKAVYVNRVYREMDFSQLGIGTT